jgi:hypothetical protein
MQFDLSVAVILLTRRRGHRALYLRVPRLGEKLRVLRGKADII